MPRPKVKPQDRQRSAKACDACKASKKRCDANQPCRLCLKKGMQDTCTFTPTARDRRSSQRSRSSRSSQPNPIAVDAAAAAAAASADVQVSTPDFGSTIRAFVPSVQARTRSQFDDPSNASGSQDAEGDEIEEEDPEDADSETDYMPDSRNSVEVTEQQRPLMLSSSSGDKGNNNTQPLNPSLLT
jgi:hypothetical protein